METKSSSTSCRSCTRARGCRGQWFSLDVSRDGNVHDYFTALTDNSFGFSDLPAPAFPIPDLDERSAPPPMSNTVGGSFLSALELPYVQPRRTIPNGVQPLLSQDFADHDARAFFDSFLNEQRVERAELQAAYGRPTTPPPVLQTTGEPLQPYAAPTSSPDPLSLSTNGDHASRTPREVLPQAHRGQRIVIAMVNGQRYDSRHIESSPGAASSSARSSSPSFSATSTPRHDNRSTSNVDPTNAHDASASTWQTPGAGTAKVESAVKKIRLTNGTTSKSTVKANEVTGKHRVIILSTASPRLAIPHSLLVNFRFRRNSFGLAVGSIRGRRFVRHGHV